MGLKQKTILLADGFRVSYLEAGTGVPLVFLHGFSVSALAYTEMLELLADSGFRVIAFDAPDHGDTDALPWGHTISDMVDILEDALWEILRTEKAIIVGHSMGGNLAAHLAGRNASVTIAAVLMDPALGEPFEKAVSVDPWHTVPLRAAQFFSNAFSDCVGDARKAGSLRVLRERLGLAKRLGKSVSGASMVKAAYALMRDDTVSALRKLADRRVRTFILHGAKDSITPVATAFNAAKLSGASYAIIGGAYHSWMIADPALASNLIQERVKRLWVSSSPTAS